MDKSKVRNAIRSSGGVKTKIKSYLLVDNYYVFMLLRCFLFLLVKARNRK